MSQQTSTFMSVLPQGKGSKKLLDYANWQPDIAQEPTIKSPVIHATRLHDDDEHLIPSLSQSQNLLAYVTTTKMYKIVMEPVRDWMFGPVSGHRLGVIVYMILGIYSLYLLQAWIWPVHVSSHTLIETIWSWGSLLWLGSVIPGSLGLAGLLAYRHPDKLDTARPIKNLVVWRIVSRGINGDALTATIRRCQAEMRKTPLFPYIIEVVTDAPGIETLPQDPDIRHIVVPSGYQTPNQSKYKARALHYASLHSPIPYDAWIVHLDEETQPTSSGIKGICKMIKEEETSGDLRIGQGCILYHRKWREHPFLTLADNVRTGDDFARFYFQHRIGVTIFGLHGSYIVVRNDIEKSIGFDFGYVGSITEDAFWALVAMQHGQRCCWVEGYLEEQSTQSIKDFVYQRRRWYQGLVKVSLYAPVRLRWRVCLGTNTFLWTLAPFASMYTIAHLFYGTSSAGLVQFLANYSFASFGVLYTIGLKANLDEYGIHRWWERLRWYALQIALLPVFSFMESTGVLLAVFRPVAGFHVVKK